MVKRSRRQTLECDDVSSNLAYKKCGRVTFLVFTFFKFIFFVRVSARFYIFVLISGRNLLLVFNFSFGLLLLQFLFSLASLCCIIRTSVLFVPGTLIPGPRYSMLLSVVYKYMLIFVMLIFFAAVRTSFLCPFSLLISLNMLQ